MACQCLPPSQCWNEAQNKYCLPWLQDTPDGNWAELERTGKKQKQKFWREMFNGLTNYRIWGLALCYAYRWAPCQCCKVLQALQHLGLPVEHKAG